VVSVEHRKANGSHRRAAFLVRWRDPDGRSRSKSFRTLSDAKRFEATVRTTLDSGTYRDDRQSVLTFEEYATTWLRTSSGGASYRASRASLLSNHVFPLIGDERLVDLDQSDLRQVVAGMRLATGKPVARSTAQATAQLMSAILRSAEDEGVIRAAPLPRTWPLPEQRPDRRAFLEVDQAEALIRATEEYWQPLVMFLADTGCRWGEAVGLTIDKVDLDAGAVLISASLAEVGGRFTIKTTKSGRSRVVSLPTRTTKALRAHVDEYGTGEFVDSDSGRRTTGLVFHGKSGAPIQRSLFRRRVWNPAVLAADLVDVHPVPHSLRHTHASHLIAGGVDPLRIAARLGHSRPSVTTDIYGHLMAGGDLETVRSLEAFRKTSAKKARAKTMATKEPERARPK